MMERHVNPEDPDLYALGALDGEEKQALEAHVRSCPACAREVDGGAAARRAAGAGCACGCASAVGERSADAAGAGGEACRSAIAVDRCRRPHAAAPRLCVADAGFWRGAVFFAALAGGHVDAGCAGHRSESSELRGAAGDGADAVAGDCATPPRRPIRCWACREPCAWRWSSKPGGPRGAAAVLYNASMGMVMCAG